MLEVRLLGQQRIVVDGANVTARVPPRSIALVSRLVLHPSEEHHRAELAALFWPESSDAQALTNLRRELHQLRLLLPELADGVVASGRSIAWDASPLVACDVVDFLDAAGHADGSDAEADADTRQAFAAEACARYTGPLLPAWTDEWVLEERDRLHRRCLALLDDLVAWDTARGDLGRALGHARRRSDMEPLEEPGYRAVMELQAATGDRAGALRTFHRCASLLERELGIGPDPATVALYESLLTAGDAGAARAPRPRRASRLPLVGRDVDLAALEQRWLAARRGRSGLHLVTGEAGVGKSRLLSELSANAERRGDLTARARCLPGGMRLAMAPAAEWLGSPGLRAQRDGLDPRWAAEVERLVPTATSPRQPAPQPMVDGWQRHRFLQGLVHAVLDAGRPVLLSLDDVQWCDTETLTWIHLLLREASGRPLLVVATARTEELADNADVGRLVVALGQEDRLTRAPLEPLGEAATATLARSAGATVVDEPALLAATRGYPLFVIESARAATDGTSPAQALDGSPRVQALLEGRLSTLSSDSAAVASLAAVVGRDFDPELLEEAGDLPPEALADALDELWRRRLIVQRRDGSYDFAHDLLRDAARRQVAPARLTLLHRRVAQALELRAGSDDGASAARVAHHYEQGGVARRALPFRVAAAEFATRRFAFADAVDHYSAGCQLLQAMPPSPDRDRQELQLRHAMSAPVNARYGYASPQLEATVEAGVELAERLHDRRLELLGLIALFAAYIVQGRLPDSYTVARRALAGSAGHDDVVGQAHFAVAGAATMLGRHAEALVHFARVSELTIPYPAALVGTRPEVHSRAWEAHTLWLVGRPEDARAAVDWAVERARDVDHPYSTAVAMAYDAMLAQFEGRRDAVADRAEQTVTLCRTYGFAYYGDWARVLAGWARGGRTGLAEVRAGIRSLDAQRAFVRRPFYLCLEADVLHDLGDDASARRTLEHAVELAHAHHDVWWLPDVLRRLAVLDRDAVDHELLAAAAVVADAQGSRALADRIDADRAAFAPG